MYEHTFSSDCHVNDRNPSVAMLLVHHGHCYVVRVLGRFGIVT